MVLLIETEYILFSLGTHIPFSLFCVVRPANYARDTSELYCQITFSEVRAQCILPYPTSSSECFTSYLQNNWLSILYNFLHNKSALYYISVLVQRDFENILQSLTKIQFLTDL